MHYVVGSGPAGVACAAALVHRGCDVTLLDAGLDLEPERKTLLSRLKTSAVHHPKDLAALKGSAAPTINGLPKKLAYGSDYPYRQVPELAPLVLDEFEAAVSLARGGLSNVWGGAVLPFSASEITDWPITWEELGPHYQAASDMIGVTGTLDDLAQRLPIFGEPRAPLRSSAQAQELLSDLKKNRDPLRERGVTFGSSRLAVRAEDCQYCGLCLYGCPREVPYASTTTLDRLSRTGRFRYEGETVVDRIAEGTDGVTLEGSRLSTGARCAFRASRVYLGCGPLSTARLLLRSMRLYDTPVRLRGSQYFLLPWLRYEATPGVTSEALHTLAQVFLEMEDPAISGHTVHLQVYSYNDLYQTAIIGRAGRFASLLGDGLAPLLGRLLVIQGYLHSREARDSEIRLVNEGESERLLVRGFPDRSTHRRARAVARKLLDLRSFMRAVPLLPLLQIGKPGSGHHIGGTFPMRRAPASFESDIFGRPHGFRRVHLVDASTFPSIPATTITLSIMANAHRIGAVSEKELG